MNRLWLIFAAGLVLRLILIPSYVHPDLKGFNFAGFLISQKHAVFTFYDYLSTLPPSHQLVTQYHQDLFIYPPLAYLTPAVFMKVLGPFYPWQVFEQYVFDDSQTLGSPDMAGLVFLLKLPYLIADFMILFLLLKLVSPQKRYLAAAVWLFNPVTLYATYLIGQFDIYLALFVTLSIYFASQNRPIFSALSLGLSAGFKPFPLFLLPLIPAPTGLRHRLVILISGLAVFLLVISPYLPSPGFRNFALLAPQSDKLTSAKIMVSTSQYLPLFFLGLVFVAWRHYFSPHQVPMWGWLATAFLLFFSLTHFHPQWFVWAAPCLALWFVHRPANRLPLAALTALFFAVVMTFEPSLNWQVLGLDLSSPDLLAKIGQTDQLPSLFRGAFAATSLYLVHSLFQHA